MKIEFQLFINFNRAEKNFHLNFPKLYNCKHLKQQKTPISMTFFIALLKTIVLSKIKDKRQRKNDQNLTQLDSMSKNEMKSIYQEGFFY